MTQTALIMALAEDYARTCAMHNKPDPATKAALVEAVEAMAQALEAAKRDAAKYHAPRDSGYLMPVEFDAAVTKAMFAQEVK